MIMFIEKHGRKCAHCWCFFATCFTGLFLSVFVHEYSLRAWTFASDHLLHATMHGPQ